MAISTVANTRNPVATTTGTTLPDYMAGLEQYTVPKTNIGTTTATQMVGDPLQATIQNAPSLEKVANIISNINQQSYLSAPGRQQELANIQRWQAGELDPAIYAQEASRAAQLYGGGGFGVDSPAWQAAIQRALVTNRQALQEKGASALEAMYAGLPKTDVTKYTLSPTDYASVLDAQRARQLQLAGLQQQGALESAKLAQARAFQEQELALKQQEYELRRAAQQAQLYAKGYGQSGALLPTKAPSYSDWMFTGYSRPPSYARY